MSRLISILLLLPQLQSANVELGYRITIPSGFIPFPEAKTQSEVVDCWTEPRPEDALVLCVHRLRRVLPRNAMRQLDLPADNTLSGFKWMGFDIQGLRTVAVQQGERVFVLSAQVPLRREAVQLTIGGPATEEVRGRALMTSTLATFEGESSWLSESNRATRLRNIAGWWIGIAVALVIVLRWRKRRIAGA